MENEPRERTTAVLMLAEFWCSDCTSRSLFEGLAGEAADAPHTHGGEWVCTACGAAYFDAIDLVVDASADDASASGLAAERGVLVVG